MLRCSQGIYVPGDTILITTEVFNPDNYQVDIILESSLANQDGTYPTTIIPNFITLDASEKKIITLYNFQVDPELGEGTYSASTRFLINNNVISSESLTFQIKDTLKEMQIDFKTCKDQYCNQESNVFILNEDIYLDYISEISDANVIAIVTYPDDSTNQFVLPTSIKAEQIGTYELEVTASKAD